MTETKTLDQQIEEIFGGYVNPEPCTICDLCSEYSANGEIHSECHYEEEYHYQAGEIDMHYDNTYPEYDEAVTRLEEVNFNQVA